MANVETMRLEHRGRVLLVDGDPAARTAGAKSLTRAGFETRSARAEPDALRLAATETFDLLLVDLDLPKMDGLSLLRRLHEANIELPVLWLTAARTNEIAASAFEAGVLQVLENPVDAKTLERVVALGVNQTRHMLNSLRGILRPHAPHHSVTATDAKNEFGNVLNDAVKDGAVVITKHNSPAAVLVSVDRVGAFLARHEPDLGALTVEFDEMVARIRTPAARAAARGLFSATPNQFGNAAVAGAKRRGG